MGSGADGRELPGPSVAAAPTIATTAAGSLAGGLAHGNTMGAPPPMSMPPGASAAVATIVGYFSRERSGDARILEMPIRLGDSVAPKQGSRCNDRLSDLASHATTEADYTATVVGRNGIGAPTHCTRLHVQVVDHVGRTSFQVVREARTLYAHKRLMWVYEDERATISFEPAADMTTAAPCDLPEPRQRVPLTGRPAPIGGFDVLPPPRLPLPPQPPPHVYRLEPADQ